MNTELDRFAIARPPAHCAARLRALVELGLERLAIIGRSAFSDPSTAAAMKEEMIHNSELNAYVNDKLITSSIGVGTWRNYGI
jgi:hypothetical protein